MRRDPQNARRFNDRITLTRTEAVWDEMSHASIGQPVAVLEVYAQVRQMSATKTMMTFQQADVVGVDIEMRRPAVAFDGITWRGHEIHFPTPEDVGDRGRFLRISGWYQADNPVQADPYTEADPGEEPDPGVDPGVDPGEGGSAAEEEG